MPGNVAVQAANLTMTKEGVQTLKQEFPEVIERLGERGTLVEVASSHLGLTTEDANYLDAFPSGVKEAMRAAVVDAIDNDLAIQFQFKPAYDFAVEIWEFGDAMGVHLSGPYTGAAFPRESYVPAGRGS
jgi:hypothetical protein